MKPTNRDLFRAIGASALTALLGDAERGSFRPAREYVADGIKGGIAQAKAQAEAAPEDEPSDPLDAQAINVEGVEL